MGFDPVSFLMGAKSAGGGGGSGGGFTLLHGTYSITQDDEIIVTLAVTASELYALMQTSAVAYDYTQTDGAVNVTNIHYINAASHGIVDGNDAGYFFYTAAVQTPQLQADDVVVFSFGN